MRKAPGAWLTLRRMRWPRARPSDGLALLSVLRSGNWGGWPSPNQQASRFADRFARMHDAAHGICTSSGTTALQIVYRGLGIGPGDQIIVPALTFSSVAGAAVEIGAEPVFADVDPTMLCVDPRSVDARITPRTRAVVAVHLGAQICNLDALRALCADRGLALIEDCAHAHGGKWRGRGVGAWSTAGCFSFQSTKALSAGEGGMILTNDAELAARCRSLINCGRPSSPDQRPQSILGGNYRMTELQAALLTTQLRRFPAQLRRRAESIALLDKLLANCAAVEVLKPQEGLTQRPCYAYAFRLRRDVHHGIRRDRFLSELFLRGYPASAIYQPVYDAPEYGRRDPRAKLPEPLACPEAERAARETVWLSHMLLLCGGRAVRRLAEAIESAATAAKT
jgi:dTDP-4-amino-4,6-dideoxygalactose transaminase